MSYEMNRPCARAMTGLSLVLAASVMLPTVGASAAE